MQTLTSHNTTDLIFTIPELVPYINWIYFYHAWGIREEQGSDLQREADEQLTRWAAEDRQAVFRFRLFEANSQGEDILLYGHGTPADANASAPLYTLPLLRQQREPFLCLADFPRWDTRARAWASSHPPYHAKWKASWSKRWPTGWPRQRPNMGISWSGHPPGLRSR